MECASPLLPRCSSCPPGCDREPSPKRPRLHRSDSEKILPIQGSPIERLANLATHFPSDLKKQFKIINTVTTYNSFYAAVGGVYGNVEEQHKERNRYPDTFPYASNRVTLKRYENDYINASWIVHEGHTYIATQAPINATINHFWKMVFEAHRTDSDAGVGQIVMLADETIPTQSTAYWPVKDEGTYVKVTVTIVERKEMQPGIIFRRLTLSKEGQPTKTLHHWQFKAWPDKKVPVMTDFHNFFALVEADRLQNFPNHIQLVHCSAGLGRTGVYIAWKGLLAQIKAGKSCLNLFQTLVDLRRQRMNMVPSFVQYEFLQRLIEHQLNSEKK